MRVAKFFTKGRSLLRRTARPAGKMAGVALALMCLGVSTPAMANGKVSAAAYNSLSNTYYFFFGDTYVAKKRGKPLSSTYKPITAFGANFPGTWGNKIDAALFNPNTKKYYFFRKLDGRWWFISKEYGGGKSFTAPRSMDQFGANNFSNKCGVDAATYDPIGKIYYFFKKNGSWCTKKQGGKYNIEIGEKTFTRGYPQDFRLRAVAMRTGGKGDSKYYFFSNQQYISKIRGEPGFSNRASIPNGWPNWPR